MRPGQDRGRADHDGSSVEQGHGQLADVGHGQIEQLHRRPPGGQGGRQMLDHAPGAAVHGHEGQDDQIGRRGRGPLPGGGHDPVGLVVDLAVAGSDHVDGQAGQLVQVLFDHGPKRGHDLGEVALGRLAHPARVGDEQLRGGDVGAEEIAAEKDAVLGQIAGHGLGPVHPGQVEEGERLAAKLQPISVGHGLHPVLGESQQIKQHGLALGRGQHLGFGIAGEQ